MTFGDGSTTGNPSGFGDSTRLRAVETYTSRGLRVSGGKRERTRTFIVYATVNAGTVVPSSNAAIQTTGVGFGDPHPEDADLFAVDVDVRILERMGRRGMQVVFTYRGVEISGGGSPQAPDEPDFQTVDLVGSGFFVDAWRVPSPGDTPWSVAPGEPVNTSLDIGGESVDIGGTPREVFVRQGRYEIVRNYRFTDYRATDYLRAIGARNDDTFVGFPAGALLYGEPRASRVNQGVVRVVHSLILDEFFHLRQVPDLDPDTGEIVLGNTGQAAVVRWFQPFPRLLDFAALDMIAPGTPVPGGGDG